MKTHTSDFKNTIKQFGRQIDFAISYGIHTIFGDNINSASIHYEGGILKSVMKQLDLDINVDIPEGTLINAQFALMVNGDYEALDYGDFIVYKSEKQEDTNSYKLTCYDKMLYAMKDYEALNITYPITIRNYIGAICSHLNLTFASSNVAFANYDKEIPNELYLDSDGNSLGYTFRDVLDELAEVTASTICINDLGELEVRYITDTGDTINEEYFKNVNVNFGQKFGAVNTIVLSRSAGADNIYYPAVLPENPYEIKISDNQIMNGNDRADYLPDIYAKLNGLEYYLNDFASPGIMYYDLCDRYTVSIGGNTYSCVMFNDEINITQGIEENIHTDMPEETVTDYTKADKTDRKINQTYLMVDKQNGIIQSLVDKTVYVSDTKSGVGSITLENAYPGELYKLSIKGQISLLFPQSETLYGSPVVPRDSLMPSNTLTPSNAVPYGNAPQYPSSELFTKNMKLLIDEDEYELDIDFLNYISNDVCDEFVYENGECKIIRRVGINSQGEKFALDNEVIEKRKGVMLNVKASSVIALASFSLAILSATYLLDNDYTHNFATEIYVNSEIKQTADSITQQVNAKVGDDEIIAKLNLAIEDGQGVIQLTGNQIVINSDHFTVDGQGNIACENANISGTITSNNGAIGGWTVNSSGLHNADGAFIENDGYSNVYTVVDLYILSAMLQGNVSWIPMPQSGTPEFERYDINKDGVIDIRDLAVLRQKTLGQ